MKRFIKTLPLALLAAAFLWPSISLGQEEAEAASQPPQQDDAEAQTGDDQPGRAGRRGLRGRRGGRRGRGARRGGRRGRGAQPDPTAGFTQIFDGQSLDAWEGDPRLWRVEEGAIVGETSAENRIDSNTFLIWRGGDTRDFELKLEVRLTGGNSGIQYRSSLNEEVGPWSLSGYQADFDAANRYSGMLYEERGRGFLAMRGQFMRRTADGQFTVATLGEGEDLAAAWRPDEFNQFHIIARGNTLLHFLNGRLTAGFIDEDAAGRASEGVLGLQLHTGPPMKLEVRNVWFKELAGP